MSEIFATKDQCEHILEMRREWRENQDVDWCLAASFINMEALHEARKLRQKERA